MGKRRRIFSTSGPVVKTPPEILDHLRTLYPQLQTSHGLKGVSEHVGSLHAKLTQERDGFVETTYLDNPDLMLAYDTYMLYVAKADPDIGAISRPFKEYGTTDSSPRYRLWHRHRLNRHHTLDAIPGSDGRDRLPRP